MSAFDNVELALSTLSGLSRLPDSMPASYHLQSFKQIIVWGLEVQVGDDDMGRVIGKRGRVANSIRTVVRAAAARDGVEVDVEFVD